MQEKIMKKIPDHILEAINCNEAIPSDFYEEYGKEEIDKALENLKKSDDEILERINADQFYETMMAKNIFRKRKNTYRSSRFIPLVAAAACVLLIFPLVFRGNNKIKSHPETSGIRIKGQYAKPEIILYKQASEKAELLKDKENVQSGDLIQIAFNPGGRKYCLIFSIDGNSQITNHLSVNEESQVLCEVENKHSLLNFSYELDDAPDYELFVMITSDECLDLTKQIEKLAGKNIRYIRNGKYLPSSAEITTVLLKKNKDN